MKSFVSDKNKKLSKLALEKVEGLSFSALNKLLRNKDVKINGKRIKEDCDVKIGDRVEIYCKDVKQEKYSIVYSDENVVVVDKKSGYTSESVFESVAEEFFSAKFIHRLDRNTSGLMIFAKNEHAETELSLGFKERTFDKIYKAYVFGKMPAEKDVLTAYLVKDAEKSEVSVFKDRVDGGAQIKTGYEVLSYENGVSELAVTLFTGKTHQIRAHLAFIGHPVCGDGKYGDRVKNKEYGFKTQRLSAESITLHFPDGALLSYLNGKTFVRGNV